MEALVFGFLVKLIMVPVTRIHQFYLVAQNTKRV